MSETANEKTTLEVIEEAKRSLIMGGVTGISSGGRNVSFISAETLAELEREEKLKEADGIYAKIVQSTPYDPRW